MTQWAQLDRWPFDTSVCNICGGRDGRPLGQMAASGALLCPHCVRAILHAADCVPTGDYVAQAEKTEAAVARAGGIEKQLQAALDDRDEQRRTIELLERRVNEAEVHVPQLERQLTELKQGHENRHVPIGAEA